MVSDLVAVEDLAGGESEMGFEADALRAVIELLSGILALCQGKNRFLAAPASWTVTVVSRASRPRIQPRSLCS